MDGRVRGRLLAAGSALTLAVGAVHLGVAAVQYAALSFDAFWFAGSRLAVVLIGALTLLARTAPAHAGVRWAARSSPASRQAFHLGPTERARQLQFRQVCDAPSAVHGEMVSNNALAGAATSKLASCPNGSAPPRSSGLRRWNSYVPTAARRGRRWRPMIAWIARGICWIIPRRLSPDNTVSLDRRPAPGSGRASGRTA